MIRTAIKFQDRVRTLVDVGPKLPAGSVGVVVAVDVNLYPNDTKGESYVIVVVFPTLQNGSVHYADIEGLDPKSVPHMNAVPFKISEVEKIDSLAIEA